MEEAISLSLVSEEDDKKKNNKTSVVYQQEIDQSQGLVYSDGKACLHPSNIILKSRTILSSRLDNHLDKPPLEANIRKAQYLRNDIHLTQPSYHRLSLQG